MHIGTCTATCSELRRDVCMAICIYTRAQTSTHVRTDMCIVQTHVQTSQSPRWQPWPLITSAGARPLCFFLKKRCHLPDDREHFELRVRQPRRLDERLPTLHSYGLDSYGLYSYGPHSYGPHSYGLFSYGLYSYGLYSCGLYSNGLNDGRQDRWHGGWPMYGRVHRRVRRHVRRHVDWHLCLQTCMQTVHRSRSHRGPRRRPLSIASLCAVNLTAAATHAPLISQRRRRLHR